MTTWVPQSCTLPTTEQPLRVAEFDVLFRERLCEWTRPDRMRLQLVLRGGPGVAETVRDLVDRESGCCSFFTFSLVVDADRLRLSVTVDEPHQAVLDALQERLALATGRERP
ncbi:hypothetical protein DVA86_18985 [Streptomyces armeniacus]|uniref:Arsenate reductase n=1 Tax=Streptomyces armeniacus TaxID=83291 RepID=A0A345XS06_9ACTN|nr:hypothetical protein [Streptomyces armeniacus]AXK34422.1 hypothetical protein DVA86_18985 [Streptomyces armeniacus]